MGAMTKLIEHKSFNAYGEYSSCVMDAYVCPCGCPFATDLSFVQRWLDDNEDEAQSH